MNENQQLAARHGYTQQHYRPISLPEPRVHWQPTHATIDLKWILDERGGLMELMRASWCALAVDASTYAGQAYISATEPDVVKAWHLHAKQYDRFVCVRGRVVLGLCDLRTSEVSRVVLDAEKSPKVVIIPPGVAHGWKCLGSTESWILNLVSHEYDGTDEYRRPADAGPTADIDFDWHARVDG